MLIRNLLLVFLCILLLPLDAAAKKKKVEDRVDDLESQVAILIALLEGVSRFKDANGYETLEFSGMNVQVNNGSGSTDGAPDGIGNVIIGYNSERGTAGCPSGPSCDRRTGSHNLIIGDFENYTSYGGLVVGHSNEIANGYAVVSGGRDNTASGIYSSVSGGAANRSQTNFASVSGGSENMATGAYSSVSGGHQNTAGAARSSVSGGTQNSALGEYSSVSSGLRNSASGESGSVTGGRDNVASQRFATVSGGAVNNASGVGASVSGGTNNTSAGRHSSVSGGIGNSANGEQSAISGGGSNRTYSLVSSISGGVGNQTSGNGSSISGGSGNSANSNAAYSSISGGRANFTSYEYSAIGGGENNRAGAPLSSVCGGTDNNASGYGSSICGGAGNKTIGSRSTVSGGINNSSNSVGSSILGGVNQSTSSGYETISGLEIPFYDHVSDSDAHHTAYTDADAITAVGPHYTPDGGESGSGPAYKVLDNLDNQIGTFFGVRSENTGSLTGVQKTTAVLVLLEFPFEQQSFVLPVLGNGFGASESIFYQFSDCTGNAYLSAPALRTDPSFDGLIQFEGSNSPTGPSSSPAWVAGNDERSLYSISNVQLGSMDFPTESVRYLHGDCFNFSSFTMDGYELNWIADLTDMFPPPYRLEVNY